MESFDPPDCEVDMVAANAVDGSRTAPRRVFPVPTTVSEEMQAEIARPYRSPAWNMRPKDRDGWKRAARALAEPVIAGLPQLRDQMGVVSEPALFGGVRGWWIRPASPRSDRPMRRLLHIHGGGYVYWPGEAGTVEAILMAGQGDFEVATIDYRLAHDAPYPAALDDVMEAWRALLDFNYANELGVFGTSTGGALTLSLVLRSLAEGVALPAAIGVGTPWSDLTKTGDSYFTNEWVDGVEVSYHGFLAPAAEIYAAGHDLKDPMLSPVYGDFGGAPPTILLTGTRDLFLSNTVRVHRRMRQAGVDAHLHVFEGQSHAQYMLATESPECNEAYGELASFFRTHISESTGSMQA
jgi:epsilon-lactone hydrolase